jgi:hypothetical protein
MAQTYTQLVSDKNAPGSIARWVNVSTIQGDTPEIITEAESWIYRRLRHFKMLTDPIDGTMTIGNDYIDSPSDLLEPFLLWTTGPYQQLMTQRTPQEVIANWQYTGTGTARVQQQPLMYYQGEDTLRFDSPANLAYDYNLIYFKQPAPLSETNTNFLTVTYPRLMRCACMAAACEWAKDNGQGQFDRTYWDVLAQEEIEKAQTESDRAKRGTVAGMILIGGGGGAGNFPTYVTGY